MGTDLNAPLGQNRKPPKDGKARSVFSTGRFLLVAGIVGLVGLSAVIALSPSGLSTPEEKPAEVAVAQTATEHPEATKPPLAQPQPSAGMSGANVRETLTDDGSVVTTFSPKQRDGEGPAFISAGQTRGQDQRVAAQPNEALLEDTPEGRLPIVGPDGLRPMDQYARPWSGARGTRIAIVVSGLGLSQTGTQTAIRKLSPDVTLAFAASGNSLQRWMQEARHGGHEILLQIPLEPFDYPDNDPGPMTLRTGVTAAANLKLLRSALGEITNYTGVMNFLGARFLSNADAFEPVMRDLSKRGLLFLDDGTSAQSLTGTLAGAMDVPHGFADLVLDNELERGKILKKLDELERIARRNGTAIGVASAFDESIEAISSFMEEAEARGIEFVGVSALVQDPKQN